MRRIKLRQRGFRPQGTPFTGENVNKSQQKTVKKTEKKETVATKVRKAIKKVIG